MIRVVDTHVLVLGDAGEHHDDLVCAQKAIRYLAETQRKFRVGLDSGGLILKEYEGNARKKAQPGLGHAFLIHLYTNQYNPRHACQVVITKHPDREFVEFPDDPSLDHFDRSDRKFVAVALAAPDKHEIAYAEDTEDWQGAELALRANGVDLRYLCAS